jgi:hypothetical protein
MAWDLIGHEWAVEMLSRHVAASQVRHAYLLTGPEGVGKRALALQFVQALHCAQPPAPGDRCGSCLPWLEGKARRFSGSRPSGSFDGGWPFPPSAEVGGLPCSPASTKRQSKLRTPC